MHFVPCNINEANSKRRTSDIRKLLMRIVESKEECVEIKDYEHATPYSCAGALRARIKKDRLKQLKVVVSGKRIFVINTLLVKEVK